MVSPLRLPKPGETPILFELELTLGEEAMEFVRGTDPLTSELPVFKVPILSRWLSWDLLSMKQLETQ